MKYSKKIMIVALASLLSACVISPRDENHHHENMQTDPGYSRYPANERYENDPGYSRHPVENRGQHDIDPGYSRHPAGERGQNNIDPGYNHSSSQRMLRPGETIHSSGERNLDPGYSR